MIIRILYIRGPNDFHQDLLGKCKCFLRPPEAFRLGVSLWKVCSPRKWSPTNREALSQCILRQSNLGEEKNSWANHQLPSPKLTWPLKMGHSKRKLVFQPYIFRGKLLVSGRVIPKKGVKQLLSIKTKIAFSDNSAIIWAKFVATFAIRLQIPPNGGEK